MNKELEDQLVKEFPKLYKNYGGDMSKTCMHWGFSCGDGWFKIIKDLSEKIEPLGAVASQVKEKFGGLSFYIEGLETNFDIVYKYIDEAEELSYATCEICGQPGETKGKGWIKTLCDKCRDDKN